MAESDAEAFLCDFAHEYRCYPNLRARTVSDFAARLRAAVAAEVAAAVAAERERLVQVALSAKLKIGPVAIDNPGDPGLAWNGGVAAAARAIRQAQPAPAGGTGGGE